MSWNRTRTLVSFRMCALPVAAIVAALTSPAALADSQRLGREQARALRTDPLIRGTVRFDYPPTGVGFAFGSVWVMMNGGRVARVDPRTNRVVATIVGAGFPVRAEGGFGSVWVTNCEAGHVTRINPKTNKVVAAIPTGACPLGIATLGGSVWVVNADDHVSRINPANNRVKNIRMPIAECPQDSCYDYRELTAGFGAVWVATHRSRVLRIDPKTNRVTTIRIAPELAKVSGVAVGFGSVWATVDEADKEIVRIAPRTLKVTARITSRQAHTSMGVAFRGRMWFGHNYEAGALVEAIDPETNRSVAAIEVGSYADVVTGAGSLWAKSYSPQLLYRIDPGK